MFLFMLLSYDNLLFRMKMLWRSLLSHSRVFQACPKTEQEILLNLQHKAIRIGFVLSISYALLKQLKILS